MINKIIELSKDSKSWVNYQGIRLKNVLNNLELYFK